MHFYRGRADQVAYSRRNGKDADFKKKGSVVIELTPGEQEIDALRKLNGGERVWEKTGSTITKYSRVTADSDISVLLPDVKWKTKDRLLHFKYGAYVSDGSLRESLTVSTGGYQEREDRTSDRTKMNRDDARAAWELGVSITTMAGGNPREIRDGLRVVAKAFTNIRAAQPARAADPSLALWELPAQTGDLKQDRQAMDKFLARLSDRIVKALGADEVTEGEPTVAGCFELGRSTPLMTFVLRADDPKLKAEFLAQFAVAGRNSNLPKEFWEPLIEKARAGVPIDDITAASVEMFNEVTKFLNAKQAEWKPPKPVKEE